MAVGIRKEDTELLQAINDGLEELKADGTYDDIRQRWFSN
ncbi:MAG: transporter substrate-binding domain-containing protein [Filifactor alocis]